MARLTAAEKEELEQLRSKLSHRIEELTKQETEGNITRDEMHSHLEMEFGKDWMHSIARVNKLLYKNHHNHETLSHSAIVMLLVVALSTVFLAGVLFTPNVTAAVTAQKHVYDQVLDIETQLIPGQKRTVSLSGEIRGMLPTVTYEGNDVYALHIHDATGKRILLHGTRKEITCVSCEKTYIAPITLELEGAGTLTITEIAYRQKRSRR